MNDTDGSLRMNMILDWEPTLNLFDCEPAHPDVLLDRAPEGHILFYILSTAALDGTRYLNRVSLGITAQKNLSKRLGAINAKNHTPLRLIYYGNGPDKTVRKWEQFVKALFSHRLVDGAGKETFDLTHDDIGALGHILTAMHYLFKDVDHD